MVTGTYQQGFFTIDKNTQQNYPELYLIDPPKGKVDSFYQMSQQTPDCQPSGAYWKGRDGITQYCGTDKDKIFFTQCRVTPYFGAKLSLLDNPALYIYLKLVSIGQSPLFLCRQLSANDPGVTLSEYNYLCVLNIYDFCDTIKSNTDFGGNKPVIDLTTVGYINSTFTGFTSLFFPLSCYEGQLDCQEIKKFIRITEISDIIVTYDYNMGVIPTDPTWAAIIIHFKNNTVYSSGLCGENGDGSTMQNKLTGEVYSIPKGTYTLCIEGNCQDDKFTVYQFRYGSGGYPLYFKGNKQIITGKYGATGSVELSEFNQLLTSSNGQMDPMMYRNVSVSGTFSYKIGD